MRSDSESIYWFFSTAAESIAAFVAFLLTGYTLVHTLMEAAREKDGTLDEIHAVLKKRYHRRLSWLTAVTGAAIVLSLLILLVNKWNFPYKGGLMIFVSVLDLAAIVFGLMFVVSIVDPAKHERAAVGALEDIRRQLRLSDAKASPAMFFEAFTLLERLMRNYLRKESLSHPENGNFRNGQPFQEMSQILFNHQKIDQTFFEELKHLNAYRNIVFHGHVKHADEIMIEKAAAAAKRIEKLV